MRLRGRVAVVTGGGSGIGRAIARLFADEGAAVAIVDRDREAGRSVSDEMRGLGLNVEFYYADVARASDVEAMVETVATRQGGLHVLVNNAAVQVMAPLVDTTEGVWDQIHNVNLKGVFLGCKYAIPQIIRSGGGSIVNMGSVLGFVGDPELAAYCAAKGGVIALTKAAALTYGTQGVRVNCICPGDVETPLLQAYMDKDPDPARLRAQISAKYALRRVATPVEIAQAALFLASDASAFMTGSTMVVDGGLTVKCY